MDCVAFEVAAIEAYPTKSRWDASAAELVHTMLDRWHLTPGEAYVGGEAASVLRVTTRDGEPAVLKVGFPHPEAIAEALALEAWGDRCPRVLRQDPWTWSLLLERVEPGIPLSRSDLPPTEALELASDIFAELVGVAVPAGVPALSDIVGGYLASARARLTTQRGEFDAIGATSLVERGLEDAAALADSDGGEYFLHGDYNPGNLLLHERDSETRFVVIDPKPMRGDREFDLWPLVEQLGTPWTRADPAETIARQLRLVTDRVGCDHARAVHWAFARAALNVSWYVDDGNHAAAVEATRRLQTCASLAA